jgi:hypothetical protein
MNERIQELIEQAREYATTRHPVSNTTLSVNSDLFEQKFAELIVQECMKVNSKELSITAIERLLPLYKDHFGVKE